MLSVTYVREDGSHCVVTAIARDSSSNVHRNLDRKAQITKRAASVVTASIGDIGKYVNAFDVCVWDPSGAT